MLTSTQKIKIKDNLSGKNLILFFLWIIIFIWINVCLNDLKTLWFWFLNYDNYIKIPYITFGILNTLLIGLSINLLIDKMKEIKTLNPKTGFFSFIGTFLALLTGACPWCIAGIFPVFVWIFGSNITMYSLPFHWTELQVLSFVFLIFWIYFLSKDMVCKIKTKIKIMWKIKLRIIALLWLAWTLDAAYLTNEAYKIGNKLETFWNFWWKTIWMACDVNATFSCTSVFKEDFAWIFGIPFSWIALAVYPIIMLIAFLWLKWKIKTPFKILLAMSIWGLVFNWYVIYNEYFIWAYCLLCLICTAIIITVWALSIAWLKNNIKK